MHDGFVLLLAVNNPTAVVTVLGNKDGRAFLVLTFVLIIVRFCARVLYVLSRIPIFLLMYVTLLRHIEIQLENRFLQEEFQDSYFK